MLGRHALHTAPGGAPSPPSVRPEQRLAALSCRRRSPLAPPQFARLTAPCAAVHQDAKAALALAVGDSKVEYELHSRKERSRGGYFAYVIPTNKRCAFRNLRTRAC